MRKKYPTSSSSNLAKAASCSIHVFARFVIVLIRKQSSFATAGLPAAWTANLRPPRGMVTHAQDVFCLLKCYMSSDELSQPEPVLVYPGAERDPLEAFVNRVIDHPGLPASVPAARVDTLSALSQYLLKYPQYSRAAHYVQQEAGLQPKAWHRPRCLTFLGDGPRWLHRHPPLLGLPAEQQRDVHQLMVIWHRVAQG